MGRLRRLLRRIDLWLAGHWTLCGECGYWSSDVACDCTPSWRK